MGRKKKILTQDAPPAMETTTEQTQVEGSVNTTQSEANIQNSNTDIGYAGKVTITVRHGNRVIKRYSGKNLGSWPLFKFLGQALVGTYQPQNKPFNLILVQWVNATSATTLPTTWSEINGQWSTNATLASQKIAINSTPVLKVDDTATNPNASVTFTWLVPYSAFYTSRDLKINQLYLLDASQNLPNGDPGNDIKISDRALAVFNLPVESWLELKTSDGQKGLNLIIDWMLTLGNTTKSETQE